MTANRLMFAAKCTEDICVRFYIVVLLVLRKSMLNFAMIYDLNYETLTKFANATKNAVDNCTYRATVPVTVPPELTLM